jgi:hypothetical protein
MAEGGMPSANVLKTTGKILAKKAKESINEEAKTYKKPRTVSDLANSYIANTLGAPVDIVNMALSPVGLGSDEPFLGSEQIKRKMREYNLHTGTERPWGETALDLLGPAAIVKGPKAVKALAREGARQIESGTGIGKYMVDPRMNVVKPEGGQLSEAKKAAEFRSSVAKSVNSHKMETMPGAQWASWLQANGSKSAKKEAEATGLYDWLKTQPKVTKYDIEEHIGENLPKIIVKDKAKPLQLTSAERDELSVLTKKHYGTLYGTKEEGLNEEQYNRLMDLANTDEMATVRNLRSQAEKAEKSAQKMKAEGYSYDAFVEFNLAEHLKNRADHLELNPKVYGGAKFEKEYTSPGGSNYRETMLSLPRQHKPEYTYNVHGYSPKEGFATIEEAQAYVDEQTQLAKNLREQVKTVDPSVQDAMNRAIDKMENFPHSVIEVESPISRAKNPDFNVPKAHTYDDPETDYNRIAHLRMKDRPTRDNKRALFLEELQSDWAQHGRDEGFRQNFPKLTDVEERRFQELLEDGRRNLEGDNLAEFESLMGRRDAAAYDARKIPQGPYVTDTKDWTALGLKHALKRAVDEGHDVMAWSTGQQQADRYRLSNYVNEIGHEKNPDGTYNMYAHGPDGEQVFLEEDMPIDRVREVFGKDIARKAEAEEGISKPPIYHVENPATGDRHVFTTEEQAKSFADSANVHYPNETMKITPVTDGYRNWKKLRGVNLDIGEESKGMKTYYDQLVPSAMNDVLKQIGATERVKPIDFHFEQGLHSNVDHPEYGEAVDSTHLGIEITPELRELILNEGLPHFHEGGEVDARTVKRGNIKPIDLETEFKLSKFKE